VSNSRDVYLVFVNSANQDQWEFKVDVDSRYWFNGSHDFSTSLCIPACMTEGMYDLHLKLSDPAPRLANNSDYSIRLANQNIWDASTGLNNLNHSLEITAGSSNCAQENQPQRFNYWVGSNTGIWHDTANNWSQNKIPDLCDDVVIPMGTEITINNGLIGYARSVLIQDSGSLKFLNGSKLELVD